MDWSIIFIKLTEAIISFLKSQKWENTLKSFLGFIKTFSHKRLSDNPNIASKLSSLLDETTKPEKHSREDFEAALRSTKQLFNESLIDEEEYRLIKQGIIKKYIDNL